MIWHGCGVGWGGGEAGPAGKSQTGTDLGELRIIRSRINHRVMGHGKSSEKAPSAHPVSEESRRDNNHLSTWCYKVN